MSLAGDGPQEACESLGVTIDNALAIYNAIKTNDPARSPENLYFIGFTLQECSARCSDIKTTLDRDPSVMSVDLTSVLGEAEELVQDIADKLKGVRELQQVMGEDVTGHEVLMLEDQESKELVTKLRVLARLFKSPIGPVVQDQLDYIQNRVVETNDVVISQSERLEQLEGTVKAILEEVRRLKG